jgi:predicted PurR-regulated permease PerM
VTELNRSVAASVLTIAQRTVSSTTTFLVALGIVIFVGTYVAAELAVYADGALALIPASRQPHARSWMPRDGNGASRP